LQDRRRDLHARIVQAIETLHHNRLDEQTELLAYHALRGELRWKAVAYLYQAGVRAGVRSTREDAVAWLQQALGVVDSLPEASSMLETAIDIRLELRHMLAQVGDLGSCIQRLREASKLAERLNDDQRRGQIYAFLANTHSMLGAPEEALEFGDRALKIAARLDDLQLRFLTTVYLQQAHFFLGNHQRVVELGTASLEALPSGSELQHFGAAIPVSVFLRCWLVRSLSELGQFAEAARYEAEMFRLAELKQHRFTIGLAYYYGATFRILKGDWLAARLHFERSLEAYQTGHILLQLPQSISYTAWSHAALGEMNEARIRQQEGERLLQDQEAKGIKHALESGYRCLSCTALLLGRFDEAQRLAAHAVRLCNPAHWGAAHTLQLLGDIAIHPSQFDAEAGERHYRKALAIAEQRGIRPAIAHCHFGLSNLYQRTGRTEQACEHRTVAITMYREMDMRFYLEQAEAKN
jgi:tetratricopeptide (TPR) repeat protein